MTLTDAIEKAGRAAKTLSAEQGRIARRNARRRVLVALRGVRSMLDAEYPSVLKPVVRGVEYSEEPGALRDARVLSWRRWEWKYLNPGRTAWDRTEAQEFVNHFAMMIGQPPKPVVFDMKDHGRLLGQHASDRIRLAVHGKTWDRRTKNRVRPEGWAKWRTLLHEVAHYRAHGHGRKFKEELWSVFQEWKRWRAQQHQLASAAKVDA